MNLHSLREWMDRADEAPLVVSDMLQEAGVVNVLADLPEDAIVMRVGADWENEDGSSTHALGPSFAFILWRTRPDGRVVTAHDLIGRQVVEWGGVEITLMHRHDFLEMAYVVDGEFSQLIGEERQVFPRGSVCLIDRNSVHADFVRGQDNFVVFLCMRDDFLDEAFLSEIRDADLQDFLRTALLRQRKSRQFLRCIPRMEASPAIGALIAQVLEERAANRPGSGFIIKGLMVRILESLASDYAVDRTRNRGNRRSDLLFYEMDAWLRSHLRDGSLPGIAARFHFQESYISRLIKEHAGIPFSRYLQELRMEKARELLRTTRLSVHAVVQEVGYENRTHFYRLFREKVGMTPEQYRTMK